MRHKMSYIKEMTMILNTFNLIGKKNNQISVSDADQEIPILVSMHNARKSVKLVFGFIRYPRVKISLAASETNI